MFHFLSFCFSTTFFKMAMEDLVEVLTAMQGDLGISQNGRYRDLVTGSSKSWIEPSGKLFILQLDDADAATRRYVPFWNFLRQKSEGLDPLKAAYSTGVRDAFFAWVNQLSLLLHGATTAQLRTLADGPGIPEASTVLADSDAWNTNNAMALEGVRLIYDDHAYEQLRLAVPETLRNYVRAWSDFNQNGQVWTARLRMTEVEIGSANVQVLTADRDEWCSAEVVKAYRTGKSDGSIWVEGIGSHRVRTAPPGGGSGHSWYTNLEVNPSANETEAAFKAAKSSTQLRNYTSIAHDMLHFVENMEELYIVAVTSSVRSAVLPATAAFRWPYDAQGTAINSNLPKAFSILKDALLLYEDSAAVYTIVERLLKATQVVADRVAADPGGYSVALCPTERKELVVRVRQGSDRLGAIAVGMGIGLKLVKYKSVEDLESATREERKAGGVFSSNALIAASAMHIADRKAGEALVEGLTLRNSNELAENLTETISSLITAISVDVTNGQEGHVPKAVPIEVQNLAKTIMPKAPQALAAAKAATGAVFPEPKLLGTLRPPPVPYNAAAVVAPQLPPSFVKGTNIFDRVPKANFDPTPKIIGGAKAKAAKATGAFPKDYFPPEVPKAKAMAKQVPAHTIAPGDVM